MNESSPKSTSPKVSYPRSYSLGFACHFPGASRQTTLIKDDQTIQRPVGHSTRKLAWNTLTRIGTRIYFKLRPETFGTGINLQTTLLTWPTAKVPLLLVFCIQAAPRAPNHSRLNWMHELSVALTPTPQPHFPLLKRPMASTTYLVTTNSRPYHFA